MAIGKLQSGASGKLMPNAEMTGKNFFRAGILARALLWAQSRTAEKKENTWLFGNQRKFYATVVFNLGLTT